MASSNYSAWSVVAGEQPTTAKWNILGTNDAAFNSGQGFNDAALVPRHFNAGASSTTWAWVSYTPTIGGLTLGNATIDARYAQIGKTVIVRFIMTGGSTTSGSNTTITIGLPVTANSSYAVSGRWPVGSAEAEDAGNNNWPGCMIVSDVNTLSFLYYYVTGTNTGLHWSGGMPFGFGVNDTLQCTFTYEAA